jgi:hypothetical protein
MNKIWNGIVDSLLELFNFFSNISSRSSDDELTAEYKRLNQACTLSVAIIAIVCLFIWVVSSQFENLTSVKTFGAMFEGMRTPIGIILVIILGGSFLYAVFSFISLILFKRKHSLNN